MMVYGNQNTRLTGVIKKIQQKRATIEFSNSQRKLSVPMYFIHNKVHEDPKQEQELEIETWFLKKNRVIPIY